MISCQKSPLAGSDDTAEPTDVYNMTDQRPDSADLPNSDDRDPTDETEIDSVLAEASGLAQNIIDEVGQADSTSDIQSEESESGLPKLDVEEQLNEVERVLDDITEEAATPPSSPPADSADTTDPPEETASDAPPGEQPQSQEAPETQTQTMTAAADEEQTTPQPTAGPGIDISDEDLAGDSVPTLDSDEPAETEEPPVDDTQPIVGDADNKSTSETTEPPTTPPKRSFWQAHVAPHCNAGIRATAETAFKALDFLDEKFAWVGYGARRIVGWVAMAFFVAAAAIMAFTLH
jgi:hypothetical protein